MTAIDNILSLFKPTANSLTEVTTRRDFLKSFALLSTIPMFAACGANLTDEQKYALKANTAEENVALGKSATAVPDPNERSMEIYTVTDPVTGEQLLAGVMYMPVEIEKGVFLPRWKHVFDRPYRESEIATYKMAIDMPCLMEMQEKEKRRIAREKRKDEEMALAKKEGREYEQNKEDKEEEKKDRESRCDLTRRHTTLAEAEAYTQSLPGWQQYNAARANAAMKSMAMQAAEQMNVPKTLATSRQNAEGQTVSRVTIDMDRVKSFVNDLHLGGDGFQDLIKGARMQRTDIKRLGL